MTITEIPLTDNALLDIRERLAAAGCKMRPSSDLLKIRRVLTYVGDVDVTLDALLMQPRPIWLSDRIGYDLMVMHDEFRRANG